MSIDAGLRTFLLADATIAAAVAARIYPLQLPQNTTLPAVTYMTVTGGRETSNSGSSKLAHTLFQIDAWDATYSGALAVAELIRKRLDAYKGAAGTQTIRGAFLQGERSFYEDEPKQYRVSRDFMIWFDDD